MLAFLSGNWLVLVALGIISWFIYKVYILPYYLSPLRNLPGPPSESLFYGNFKGFFAEEAGEPHLRWIKQYGNIVKFHGLFNKPAIVVADTKALQEILLNQAYDFHKFKMLRGDFKYIIGQGVGLVEGEVHIGQRKIMNPAFSHENIKNMVPKFSQVGSILKELIENKVNKGESRIRLTPYISKATLDIIGLVGFNHEFNSLTSPSDLAKAYESMMSIIYTTTLSLSISVLSVYFPFLRQIPISINKKYNYAREVIERESIVLINERYAQGEKNPLHGNDLLSLIIKINKDLPDEEKFTYDVLRHQILGLLIGGHETSSTTIGWALYLLAEHPHEQDLLREELIKAFPDKSKFNPTFDEINSLEYLNCVVKETLRIRPMITFMSRFNVHDQVFGDFFIPKNTQIDIPIAALHRMPSIWGPTADDFDPKRWLDPSLIESITNYNYMPFSTGPRGCIGYKIALGDIKVLLSILVRNFVFQPVKGLRIRRRVGFHGKPDPDIELIVSKFEDSPKKEE